MPSDQSTYSGRKEKSTPENRQQFNNKLEALMHGAKKAPTDMLFRYPAKGGVWAAGKYNNATPEQMKYLYGQVDQQVDSIGGLVPQQFVDRGHRLLKENPMAGLAGELGGGVGIGQAGLKRIGPDLVNWLSQYGSRGQHALRSLFVGGAGETAERYAGNE